MATHLNPEWAVDGILEIELPSWKEFGDLVVSKFQQLPHYIFRRQSRADWLLEPTLTRILRATKDDPGEIARRHLDTFRQSILGRRGPSPRQLGIYDLWALGQHHGLATPLLDWTRSPYVALFFAFEQEYQINQKPKTCRTVFALNQRRIEKKFPEPAEEQMYSEEYEPEISFLRPLTDENNRLLNQAGLFTVTAFKQDLETWVKQNFKGEKWVILAKLKIPNSDRENCLRALNRMNINTALSFPIFSAQAVTRTTFSIYRTIERTCKGQSSLTTLASNSFCA